MNDAAAHPELMPSLRRLVRGLSALQWGLPLTLLVCVQSAVTEWLRPAGVLPPLVATGLLSFGLIEMRHFQAQERIWIQALERTQMFGVLCFGLSPFVFFWNKLPRETFYNQMMMLLVISGILFLYSLNRLLQRLAAMLPDETLREDTRLFTSLNINVIVSLMFLMILYLVMAQVDNLPLILVKWFAFLYDSRRLLLIFLILLPVALTMTLLWKIKDVVLASVFQNSK